jgi:hypothetical protein
LGTSGAVCAVALTLAAGWTTAPALALPVSLAGGAPTRVSVSIHVHPVRVRKGGTVTITGRLTGSSGNLGGEIVELQEGSVGHGGFVDVAHATTRADGVYRFARLRPRASLRYRVRPASSSGKASRGVRVTVEVPIPEFPYPSGVIAAARYLSQRAGVKAFAVYDNEHKLSGTDVHMRFHSASVVKSILLVAYLQTLAAQHRGLDSASQGLLYPMIHSSDNNAASAVDAIVGDAGLDRVAREAGMVDFEAAGGWWGFTGISAADMARFFYVQDQLIPRQFDGYARWLLSTIEPSESWGIPAAARGGRYPFQVFFKGGWLPMSEGLVNQAARLERGAQTFAMAVLTRADPSMGYGEETLAGVTARLINGR